MEKQLPSRKDFRMYLVMQFSGKTNMMALAQYPDYRAVMKNYEALCKEYPDEVIAAQDNPRYLEDIEGD